MTDGRGSEVPATPLIYRHRRPTPRTLRTRNPVRWRPAAVRPAHRDPCPAPRARPVRYRCQRSRRARRSLGHRRHQIYVFLTAAGHQLTWDKTVSARMPLPDERSALRTPTVHIALGANQRPLIFKELRAGADSTQLAPFPAADTSWWAPSRPPSPQAEPSGCGSTADGIGAGRVVGWREQTRFHGKAVIASFGCGHVTTSAVFPACPLAWL